MDLLTAPHTDAITKLTPRQMEILQLLVQGQNNREIATLLSISRETVKSHVAKACTKCGVENRIQLIVMFVMWKVTNESKT